MDRFDETNESSNLPGGQHQSNPKMAIRIAVRTPKSKKRYRDFLEEADQACSPMRPSDENKSQGHALTTPKKPRLYFESKTPGSPRTPTHKLEPSGNPFHEKPENLLSLNRTAEDKGAKNVTRVCILTVYI